MFVKFADDLSGAACQRALLDANLVVKEQLRFALDSYFVQATEGTGQRVFEISLELLSKPEVDFCHPELICPRAAKTIGDRQWHLGPVTIEGITISNHANVLESHQITRGAGITSAIVDDGFDIDHPEFKRPGKVVGPFDAVNWATGGTDVRPTDEFPNDPNDHGTACAGVACAAGVDGAIGVAPDSRFMPIRLRATFGSIAEAKAFEWAASNGADVISCSWGPRDGNWYPPEDSSRDRVHRLPASRRLAIECAAQNGRDGRGTLILFAVGNGNESVDSDGYASCESVIAVAACNDRGTRCVYSDFGEAIWCSFPSSDFEFFENEHPAPLTPGIWTTDRSNTAGYNRGGQISTGDDGNYTNSFGGTSNACPGVVALVLAVNPSLAPGEVKDVLRQSCDRIDPAGGQYDEAGHSHYYGYGRINARRAVELAIPRPASRLSIVREHFEPIPDRGSANVSLAIDEQGQIESIEVFVDIQHACIGDLIVKLKPPRGTATKVVLHDRQGGAAGRLTKTYRIQSTPGLERLAGRKIAGTWTLEVNDEALRHRHDYTIWSWFYFASN